LASRADGAAKPGRVWLRRLAWGAGAVAVLTFAIEGGEYGTSDLVTQRRQHRELEADVEALRDSVSALRAEMQAVRTDPARLERLAREKYGMVQGEKELLYRMSGPAR
jgi:cell division protein FtsB